MIHFLFLNNKIKDYFHVDVENAASLLFETKVVTEIRVFVKSNFELKLTATLCQRFRYPAKLDES
jgi:hypothetical protein